MHKTSQSINYTSQSKYLNPFPSFRGCTAALLKYTNLSLDSTTKHQINIQKKHRRSSREIQKIHPKEKQEDLSSLDGTSTNVYFHTDRWKRKNKALIGSTT